MQRFVSKLFRLRKSKKAQIFFIEMKWEIHLFHVKFVSSNEIKSRMFLWTDFFFIFFIVTKHALNDGPLVTHLYLDEQTKLPNQLVPHGQSLRRGFYTSPRSRILNSWWLVVCRSFRLCLTWPSHCKKSDKWPL